MVRINILSALNYGIKLTDEVIWSEEQILVYDLFEGDVI